ncbi:hypothetical protein [Aminicella lysinilytica]|uniref:hypothetical protein n=1 Tax=Aminicella lysinilytica TaxID=433323 RepID=UPI00181547DD|nr:hypothetical protein [Aminicella lysinilytica]NLD11470.1 hypothetical protein [Clostridiales bacterium]
MGTAEMDNFRGRLQLLMAEAISELNSIGIYPSKTIRSVSVNTRARRRLGACKQTGSKMDPSFAIEISYICRSLRDEDLKIIVIHELLHSCNGCMNHGATWKAYASKVERELGYHISATVDYNDIGLGKETGRNFKYRITCNNCGKTMLRMRKSKVVVHPEYYRCSACGGMLQVDEINNN